MYITVPGRIVIVSSLLLFLIGVGSLAEASHEQIASETGLDSDLFVTLTMDVSGTELALFIVYINERAMNSKILKNPTLRQTLLQYVGSNALYVNPTTKQVVSSFPFIPEQFSVEQEGRPVFFPTRSDWVEITAGFLEGRFQVNPGGASYGSGSEGVLVMGDHIDPAEPFWVVYQGQRARFELAAPTAVVPPTTAPVSIPSVVPPRVMADVASLERVTDLEEALTHGDFSAETVAALLGLDPTLVGTIAFTSGSEELRLLFVQLEAGVQESALGADLLLSIEPLIGTGAVMIWALSSTGSDFSPWHFFVQQSGTNYVFFSASSFVELTAGFLRGGRVETGEVVAGVILLPRGVDRAAPFTVYYGSTGVTLPRAPLP